MPAIQLSDTDHILDYVQFCRDEHVAPYPAGTRVISEFTGLSMYRVRVGTEQLLRDGQLTKMAVTPIMAWCCHEQRVRQPSSNPFHSQRVGELVIAVVKELLDQSTRHDRSKTESPEVEVYDEFTPKPQDEHVWLR